MNKEVLVGDSLTSIILQSPITLFGAALNRFIFSVVIGISTAGATFVLLYAFYQYIIMIFGIYKI
jgi:hypothetical protein